MRKHLLPLLGMLLVSVLLLPACQKRMTQLAEKPSPIPYDTKIGVVAFTQPTSTSQLITGHIPEDQGRVPADALLPLDGMLRDSLTATKRFYSWLPVQAKTTPGSYHESLNPQALPRWVALGRAHNVDLLLVPQILNWHQRQGSSAGVTSSAHIRAEFFLIDVKNGRVFRRSIFEEKQVGLADNMLAVGDFFKRGGGWVTAEELSGEAIAKALKELGL